MCLYGVEIYLSLSDRIEIGRKFLVEDLNYFGGFGIVISEVIEDVLRDEKVCYVLGSVFNYVFMY